MLKKHFDFVEMQQQSMISMTAYYINLDRDNADLLRETHNNVDLLDNLKNILICSMNTKELNELDKVIYSIQLMVYANIQDGRWDILNGWINYELDSYKQSIKKILYERSSIIIQRKWKEVFKKRSSSAIIIQKVWRVSISDPKHEACRNRLLWEFNDNTTNV